MTMGKTILIVEDEQDIADLIAFNLAHEGFKIVQADSGEDGLNKAKANNPDLILLDLMLPGMNGLDVCRIIKSDDEMRSIPVIMLTARDEDVDIITGLEVGADDYITKPFSPRVLIARIRAMLRRHIKTEKVGSEPIRFGELNVDPKRHQVTVDNKPIQLTLTEFQLLMLLIRRPGWVFSRSQLIDDLREGHHVITDRAIDVQIANLRKKLGKCDHYIQTVRGIGYRMREMP
jgi:two-component system alkaline phosphatase synthesis response regulator PhoP